MKNEKILFVSFDYSLEGYIIETKGFRCGDSIEITDQKLILNKY